jgi:hypothetical protein
MSTFLLKIIAIIAMFIDHTGAILIPRYHAAYWPCRFIGRLAFPIFAFLLVEGFHHTRNVKKYLLRLGIFALISEIPYDIGFYKFDHNEDIFTRLQTVFQGNGMKEYGFYPLKFLFTNIMEDQNIFFTLFLGLLLIALMSKTQEKLIGKFPLGTISDILPAAMSLIINLLLVTGFCYLAYVIRSDYSYGGILLIVVIFLFESRKPLLALFMPVVFWIIQGHCIDRISLLLIFFATLSMVFIALYNGKEGKKIKYFFYIFYPVHLLVLFLISMLL